MQLSCCCDFFVLNLVLVIIFCIFVSTMINYITMVIYAIQFSNGIETSSDINVIERKIKKFVEQKKIAIIKKNGKKIGWIGEDLSQVKGWGWYMKK